MLTAVVGSAQTTGDYRSKQTGNWNDGSTWETYNGSAWVSIQPNAFPYVAATNTSVQTTASATHAVNLPANIVAGDLLLIFWADATANTNFNPNPPAGWTSLYNNVNGNRRYAAFYKIADGAEGSTADFTTSANEVAAQISYRISGGSFTGVPVAGVVATGTDNNPNPSNFTSGFGNVSTLWIAASHSGGDNNSSAPSAPTNYSNLVTAYTGSSNTNHARMVTAERTTTATSENPGTFDLASNVAWVANTVAIRGTTVVGTLPSSTSGAITIRNGHTVTVTANTTADQVTVDAGGRLQIGAATFTMNNGAGTDLTVNGTLAQIDATSAIARNAGATIAINSGAVYEHAMNGGVSPNAGNGGTIPTATWDINSTVNITGIVDNAPVGLGQTFGNFTWNSTQTADISFAGGFSSSSGSSIAGTLTIANTGTHDLRLLNSGATRTLSVGKFSQSNGTFYILGDGGSGTNSMTLDVAGDFSVTGGTLQINGATAGTSSGTLKVGGNFTHTGGTITESANGGRTGEIIFDGSSAQTITGGGTVSNTINYTINNTSSTGVTLATPYTIDNDLKLTDGLVYASAGKELTISSGATVTGASDASFVVGPVRKEISGSGDRSTGFVFPTGKEGAGYIPIAIASISSDGVYESELVASPSTSKGDKQSLSWIDPCQYWTVKKVSGSPATATANVTMYWNSHSSCGTPTFLTDASQMRVARHAGSPSGTGTFWATNGGSTQSGSNTTTGTVRWNLASPNTITSTTLFALGSLQTQPIPTPTPVTWGDFKAASKNNGVQLDWDIYTEIDVVRYDVERSADGVKFNTVGNVKATGGDGRLYYNWFDATPSSGNNYYRIKNVDLDGKFSYSSIIKVGAGNSGSDLRLYPNPVQNNHLSIQSPDLKKGAYRIEIFNTSGQQVYKKQLSHAGGSINQSIQLPATLKTGMYSIQLTGEGFKLAKQFLIQ